MSAGLFLTKFWIFAISYAILCRLIIGMCFAKRFFSFFLPKHPGKNIGYEILPGLIVLVKVLSITSTTVGV